MQSWNILSEGFRTSTMHFNGRFKRWSFGDWNVFVDGVCIPYCRMKFIHFLLTLVHFHADIYKQTHKTHKIAWHPYKYFLRLFERNRIQIHLCWNIHTHTLINAHIYSHAHKYACIRKVNSHLYNYIGRLILLFCEPI